ncbi:MAG: RsmB/NOP family class I SAM-dependent RNA methyltransferase [Myxococcota bacterium]
MASKSAGRRGRRHAPTARSVAAQVLLRVDRDQAFASAALDAELERAVQLSAPDRRLATELVYGVLRCEGYLDERIGRHARKGVASLAPEVRAHMRVAVYQIAILERIPAFAAVSAAVDLVRAAKGPHVASFANAVLRKIGREVEEQGRTPMAKAVRASINARLVERVTASLGGAEAAEAMLAAGPFPPPLGLRLHAGEDIDAWIERLTTAVPALRLSRGKVSPRCVLLTGAGRPDDLPGFEQAWSVQEEGSQVLGLALGARPGERVLDACAGRGNKSLLIAEEVGPDGSIDAADLHESKLALLTDRATDLGLPLRDTYAVDWTIGSGDVPDGYDRVLVDAPCSGIGTMRRRPEVLHRGIDASLQSLHRLQRGILEHAATRCRPGGRLVYAVCSVLREEAEDVIAAALADGVPLEPVEFDTAGQVPLLEGTKSLRLLPHVHGTDGYFVASFRRV